MIFSVLVSKVSASKTKNLPLNGSPTPVITFMTSLACSEPIIPGKTPKTPPSAQLGINPGSGGVGYKSL